MTKVLIDREVVERASNALRRGRVFAQDIADALDAALTTATSPATYDCHCLHEGAVRLPVMIACKCRCHARETASMPILNASQVCSPCWQRIHEQPLEPGSPPCSCPCHGLAARSITPGALDRAGRQEP
jgi:hypothetical protein